MGELISHIAACCSIRQPAQSDDGDALDNLAAGMQQLRVGDRSPQAQDSSYRSPPVQSPRLRSATASPAAAAASSTATAESPQYRVFTFDIETTGLSTTKDAIIEMALVDVVSRSSWSSLVKPEPYKKSSREAYKAHGISHYELSKPHIPTLLQALKAVHNFIHRHISQQPGIIPLLVAHNGYTFDFKALAVAVHRQQQQQQSSQLSGQAIASTSSSSNSGDCGSCGNGLQTLAQLMSEHLMVWDTLALARRLKLRKQVNLTNLQQATIREHFLGSHPSVVHRALADAQELALLLPHLLHWAAAQVEEGLDEKLLPRPFAGFVSAAAAAAAAAVAGEGDNAAAAAAADASSGFSSILAVGQMQTVSGMAGAPVIAAAAAAAGTQGVRSAAGRASSSSRGRGRRIKIPPAAAASGAAKSNSGSGDQQQQQQQQLVRDSSNGVISQRSRSAAVAAAAAIIIDSSSEGESSPAAAAAGLGVTALAAAAAVGAVPHSPLCTGEQGFVAPADGSSSSSHGTAVAAVNCAAGMSQQQHTSAISSSSSMFQSRVAADQGGCSSDATTYSSGSSSVMEQAAAARTPSRSSPASAAAAADSISSARPVNRSMVPIKDTNTISSSSSSFGGNSSGCNSNGTRPQQPAAAIDLERLQSGPESNRGVIAPDSVLVKGRSVQIMSSSAFLDLVQATLNSSSSSSSATPDPDCHFRSDLIYLGQSIPGRCDSSSGFSEVLRSQLGLPVVFLLEGLVISKTIKFSHTSGRIQAASLAVRCATRQRTQQQHIKQVAAAINSLAQLQQQQRQRQQQQDPQQQQQQQDPQQQQQLYTCMVGNSLQVRLPIKSGVPFLDTAIRQVSSSGSSITKRLVPVATPNLASVDATDRFQQILPVGAHVSVVLWPSCVWSNSKFRGVTLNCVELWLQEQS